ncbi:hypothetical protein DOK78_001567 [Enterococcus sp. DIV2402]|uniref:DUF2712 domain-containing protein n=1 Tax=Candidatus Enterococcus lowellii TaxID=2230877 RepID=A0ABZ2SMR9_9ENTE|nr:hypothetical protein [Enterococcus sp. DIV2402]MBO0464243.1 hypothetical protein [Enterococcus sp. DIV2402]
MKSKILSRGAFIFIVTTLFTSFIGFADTQDKPYSFQFWGPASNHYTGARTKETSSSMYISVTKTSDGSITTFNAKPQANGKNRWVNVGNGGTVAVGRKYEVYNSAYETFNKVPTRFRGIASTLGKVTISGNWSPDYTRESGVYVLP